MNILLISVTLLVLKLDKFKEFKEEQPENFLLILLTLLVLKLDKFKDFQEEQQENLSLKINYYKKNENLIPSNKYLNNILIETQVLNEKLNMENLFIKQQNEVKEKYLNDSLKGKETILL